MDREKQIDIIEDLLIDFDEMGFAPTTACPDPEAYAKEWKDKLISAFEGYRKQSEGEWVVTYTNGIWHFDCPFCDDGYAQKEKLPPSNYCSNCGAKLKGGEG